MKRFGLVLLAVVSFVAAGIVPEYHRAVRETEKRLVASINFYSPNDNKRVGAINLSQVSQSFDGLFIFGRLWSLPPGDYYATVYEAASSETNNPCASMDQPILRYDEELEKNAPLYLFVDPIGDETERTIGTFVLDASLVKDSTNDIGNHVVKIYPNVEKKQPTDGSKPKIVEPLACGVVTVGVTVPGRYNIPDRPS